MKTIKQLNVSAIEVLLLTNSVATILQNESDVEAIIHPTLVKNLQAFQFVFFVRVVIQ